MEELEQIKQIRLKMIKELIELMLVKGIMRSEVMREFKITRPTMLKLLNENSINDKRFSDETLAKVLDFCRKY